MMAPVTVSKDECVKAGGKWDGRSCVIDKEEIYVGNVSVADDLVNTMNDLLGRHGYRIDVRFYEPPEGDEGGEIKLLKVKLLTKEEAAKFKQIEAWYRAGKVKRLGPNSYSVPSEAFVMGITPSLVAEILEPKIAEDILSHVPPEKWRRY